MARTITEIQTEIIGAVQADGTLAGASSTSSTAIWRLWTRIVAGAIWTIEVIFDRYQLDLLARVEALKPHSLRWYQQKALDFQYGSDLPEDSDTYDNSILTEEEVTEQKIVAQAAATEENEYVKIKVAKADGENLTILDNDEYDALEAYLFEVKDAGVRLELINQQGDQLSITADIYYDPLVLNNSGQRLDGTDNTPVQAAIRSFLRNLPFNGLLIKAKLTDTLQGIQGVWVPEIRSCQAGRFDAVNLGEIDIQYLPFAGYFDTTILVLNLTFINRENL